jgi:hypothetical protein
MDFTPNINYSYNNEYIFGIPFNKSYQLLMRTTRTINGKTEDVWANTQKQYKNGEQLPKTIYLSDIQFGVMKSNKEILYNISGTHDLTLPKKNYTHFIIKGKAIDVQEYRESATPKDKNRWSNFELKHLRHNRNVQLSLPHTMERLQNTYENGRSLWAWLSEYMTRTYHDVTQPQSCDDTIVSLSRPRYFNSFKLPRKAKCMMFNRVQCDVTAKKGRRNRLDIPRIKGVSNIYPVFDYPLDRDSRYALSWTKLRHATV